MTQDEPITDGEAEILESAANEASAQADAQPTEIEALRGEVESYKSKYWLLLAESENQRKRLIKERSDHANHAVSQVLVEILHPLDNMDSALSFTHQMSDEVKAWAAGFQMILTQFKDVLAGQGIHSYNSLNQHFDPHLHEAVETVDSDHVADGTILHEFAKGYKMGDRIVRPARVKVAKRSPTHAVNEDPANN